MAKKQKEVTATDSLARLMAERYSLTMISDKLRARGVAGASISMLSCVLHGSRNASTDLTAALHTLSSELCK